MDWNLRRCFGWIRILLEFKINLIIFFMFIISGSKCMVGLFKLIGLVYSGNLFFMVDLNL